MRIFIGEQDTPDITTFVALTMKHLYLFTLAVLLAGSLHAQTDLEFDGTVPVTRMGSPLPLAWAGGINYTQVGQLDLDQDGLKDLFFFDRTGNKITTLRHTGGSGTNAYELTRAYDAVYPFAQLHDWVLLRDYDCDGREDIFSYSQAGFSVYRNTSTSAGLAFELITFRMLCDYVFSDGSSQITNLYVNADDIPGIVDVDGDGDLDVLTFHQLGSYVQYYKNLTLEEYGTCDSLDFVLRSGCWGRFAENSSTNAVSLNVECPYPVPNPELTGPDERAHAGSTVTPLDLNGDGVMDLLLGDIAFPNMVSLTNGGSVDDSFMTSEDQTFPSSDQPVELPIFPAAFHLDVDGDGKRDLLVCPSARSLAQNYQGVWFYHNAGTDAAPVFEFQQPDLFQNRMLEFGEGAYPVPFDHNGDGLMDLIVANNGYFHPSGDHVGKLALLENVGTPTAPAFNMVTDDYMGLSTSGIGNGMYPAFADVDDDGDLDMYIGDEGGKLHFYRNTATGAVAQFAFAQANVAYTSGEGIDVGRFATPQFVDLDQDGLSDLVIGEQNGNLNYIRNTGTAAQAAWTLVTDSLGRVRTNTVYTLGHSVPVIFTGESGDRELLVGSESGWLWHYTGIEGNLEGTWTLQDTSFQDLNEGFRAGLCVHDLTGDGELDLVIGNFRGGMSFWRSDAISSIRSATGSTTAQVLAKPNPTQGLVDLEISTALPIGTAWVVRNTLGQVVQRIMATGPRTTLQLEGCQPGLHVITAEAAGFRSEPVRVIVQGH
ncbi:MAG: VCBS repeat-containing protein [Flavobacteriales bacterium]|nr:VCBS repeat-containing protein [Flavobacteriales bacterium]